MAIVTSSNSAYTSRRKHEDFNGNVGGEMASLDEPRVACA